MQATSRNWVAALFVLASATAAAQDGYFSTSVLPLAVDSTSFKQAITFDTVSFNGKVHVTFYPAQGTPQAAVGPVTCKDVFIVAYDGTVYETLRDLCPGLVDKSVFGFLAFQAFPSADDSYTDLPMFAVRSRIYNPQGAGFTVEAVATATFGSGQTRVTGLRGSPASETEPAYQSNCFVANLNQLGAGGNTAPKRVNYRMSFATSGVLFFTPPPVYTGYVDVAPGQMVRLLDVFAASGATGGNDYMIDFTPKGAGQQGIMTFCTVQDNTSFQADMRLGKIYYGAQGYGAEEPTMARSQYWKADVLGRNFEIPAGVAANTHLVYFRAPDTIKCELLSTDWTPPVPARLTAAAGLEIRLRDSTGLVLGGGSGKTSTGQVFVGERAVYTSAAMDGRYLVEVESNGQNTAAVRPYTLYCTSGSGNTGGFDPILYQEPVDRF